MSVHPYLAALGFTILLSAHAWAEESAVPQDEQPESYSGQSEENRQSKKYGVWGGVGYRSTMYLLVNMSAEAAYFLNPDSFISLRASYLYGEETDPVVNLDPDSYFWVTEASLEVQGQSLALSYQHFLGNSFFAKAGFENLDVDGDLKSLETGTLPIGHLQQQNILLGVGNQWQWRSFVLGCEWLSLASTLDYTYTSYNNDLDNTLVDRFIDSRNESAFGFLYFHLGATL